MTGPLRPFLRWAGGKRWLAPIIGPGLAEWGGHYVEPFLGSGALFFAIQPRQATLADSNGELIACYRGVQEDAHQVVERLMKLKSDETTYYLLRGQRPRTNVAKAVRFIYLNRTSFNGLWRVNKQGQYNVPYGRRQVDLSWLAPDIIAAGEALQKAELLHQDFRATMRWTDGRSLIFCDPPYITGHDNNGFRKYNQKLFSWEDQEDLARAASTAAAAGHEVIVSNAHHDSLRDLYAGFFPHELDRFSSLSGGVGGRGQVREYLFVTAGVRANVALPGTRADGQPDS